MKNVMLFALGQPFNFSLYSFLVIGGKQDNTKTLRHQATHRQYQNRCDILSPFVLPALSFRERKAQPALAVAERQHDFPVRELQIKLSAFVSTLNLYNCG